MKILFVAMTNSIHTARWINMIADKNWQISVFPTDFLLPIHPLLMKNKVRIFGSRVMTGLANKRRNNKSMSGGLNDLKEIPNVADIRKPRITGKVTFSAFLRDFLNEHFYKYMVKRLSKVIKKIKPDIIHSLHILEAGYLTLDAKKITEDKFPKWILTNWGSDIHLFMNIKKQRVKIKETLANCDVYSSECHRDIELAKKLGFNGITLKVVPNSGGIDFNYISILKKGSVKPSERKLIMLKGYQGWSGRALVGLKALEMCSNYLKGYKIIIYNSSSIEIDIAAELFMEKTGIEVLLLPSNLIHEEILKYHGQSRISIGLSITDAISTSLLEAMVMGSFPIQSNTSCANEWIEDGKTAILVEPEEPLCVANAIKTALLDDKLVDNAEKINYNTLLNRVEYSKIKRLIIEQYEGLI